MNADLFIQMAMTNRCNLRCVQCGLWRCSPLPESELTTGQWKDIILKVKEWVGQPYTLNVGGGEPFMRADMVELIEFCASQGIYTSVVTNGTLLTEQAIRDLASMNNLIMHFSLDGADEGTHDRFRGKGVYRKAIEALRCFKRHQRKCRLQIASILMGNNYKQIPQIFRQFVLDEKLVDTQIVQTLWIADPNGKYPEQWYLNSPLWPKDSDLPGLLDVVDELIAYKKSGFPICNSIGQLQFFKEYFRRLDEFIAKVSCNIAQRNFIIRYNGDVAICWNLDSFGNVLHDDLSRLWNSSLSERVRQDIRCCKLPCRILNCNFDFSESE